jgi:hypothetical protein
VIIGARGVTGVRVSHTREDPTLRVHIRFRPLGLRLLVVEGNIQLLYRWALRLRRAMSAIYAGLHLTQNKRCKHDVL